MESDIPLFYFGLLCALLCHNHFCRLHAGDERRRTTLLLTGGIIALELPSALSYSGFRLTIAGVRVLDYLEETVGTLGIPIAALLTSVTFTWFLEKSVLESQIDAGGDR